MSSELNEDHFCPSQQGVFQITPLNWTEWFAVICFSIPVIFLDECLKYLSRSLGMEGSTPEEHPSHLSLSPGTQPKPKMD